MGLQKTSSEINQAVIVATQARRERLMTEIAAEAERALQRLAKQDYAGGEFENLLVGHTERTRVSRFLKRTSTYSEPIYQQHATWGLPAMRSTLRVVLASDAKLYYYVSYYYIWESVEKVLPERSLDEIEAILDGLRRVAA